MYVVPKRWQLVELTGGSAWLGVEVPSGSSVGLGTGDSDWDMGIVFPVLIRSSLAPNTRGRE
jgi:hypothetical protein